MDGRLRFLSSWLLAVVLVGSLTITACGPREERVYDIDHRDYHTWNREEAGHYNQWAAENHRDPNRDFRRLPPEEQREYWTWRHSH